MLVPKNFPDRSVCVLGLGYVGLTLAVTLASSGFRVRGVEIRKDVVRQLSRGRPHFHESGLADQLQRAIGEGSLTVHDSVPADCDATVFVITVGTPLSSDGRVRLDMIRHVAQEVANTMPAGALVIMRSTVKLGTTRELVAPILAARGALYDLAFCPERTLEGVAMQELRALPQIVGGEDLAACVRAAQFFQFITPTTVRVRDLETAEMIKLIDNAQRDVHFAFSNEVARMCDAIGISAAEVIKAGKLGYARTNLAMPGPVGGPCLEKDSYILAEYFENRMVQPEIVLAARRVNERQPAESVAAIKHATKIVFGFPARPVVALLGLAFKGRPATDDLRGTMARPILAALMRHFDATEWRGFDAVVSAGDIGDFGLQPCPSIETALTGAHLAIIANNHAVFSGMPIELISSVMAKPAIIYDFWNNFDARSLRLPQGVTYMALGHHHAAFAERVVA